MSRFWETFIAGKEHTLLHRNLEYAEAVLQEHMDEVHTASAWAFLQDHISIPVERVEIERLKEHKSLVDLKLAMRASKEFYKNNVDSFVIVS